MDIRYLMPAGEMPRSGRPCNGAFAWSELDPEEAYRKRGGHPIYNESSIEYRYNSHGYRCAEFTEQAEIRMISIGCSDTEGAGLPQDAIFHEMFAERLRRETGKTVVNWNLGLGATGNDVIERALHLAVPLLDPHIVLILFSEIARREYVSPNANYVLYFPALLDRNPDVIARIQRNGPPALAAKLAIGHMAAIASQEDDEMRFFRSYKSIEALLSGRLWLFGFNNRWTESRHVFKHVDAERYVGSLPRLDLARDCSHAGPYSHERLGGKFWNTFETLRTRNEFAAPSA